MKLKIIAGVLGLSVIASLATISAPAFATTKSLGALGSGDSDAFGGGAVRRPTTFTFTLTQEDYLQLSATISNTSLKLTGSNLVLSEKNRHGVYVAIDSVAFVEGNGWTSAIGTAYPGLELQKGSYEFTFVPFSAQTSTAAIGYSYSVNGVPELSTWTMMLAGFGALGFAGFSRSQKARPLAV